MEKIHVSSDGKLETTEAPHQAGPVLLFGEHLLRIERLPSLVRRVAGGQRPVYIATNQLTRAVSGMGNSLALAGLVAVEFPLPTSDPLEYDRMAGGKDMLQETLDTALELYRVGINLWVRVPLGDYNCLKLPELCRFLTNEVLGVRRVLFHCSASLSRAPRGVPAPDGHLAGFADTLYTVLLELESARIWTGVEHRDGFPLCLFGSEPEPLRYFKFADDTREGSGAREWVNVIEARPQDLRKPEMCERCTKKDACRGMRRDLAGLPGAGDPKPFPQSRKDQVGSPRGGTVFRGAARRLRQFYPFRREKSGPDGIPGFPPRGRIQISPRDAEAAGLDRIRLDGFRLGLARIPWFGNPKEPIVPSLALTNLVPFVRNAGVSADPIDARLLVKADPNLSRHLESLMALESDVAVQMDADWSADSARRYAGVASVLVDHLETSVDLLGLSVETPGCLPLALAMVVEWKARGGGPAVIGGRGRIVPRRMMEETSHLDFCVHGEGEVPLLMLCESLKTGRDLCDVPGLMYRDAAGKIQETHSVVHSLDLHPMPDIAGFGLDRYDAVPSLDDQKPFFPYQFILGCPHSCSFCGEFNRWRYRVRDPQLVARDLGHIANEFGCRQFQFVNSQINVTRAYLEQWLEAMEKARLQIQWCDCCRPAGLDKESLIRMRRTGCTTLIWGIDIMSKSLNRRLWKSVDIEQAAEILRLASQAGIRNSVNLIVGMPHETGKDIRETIDYLRLHASSIDDLTIGIYSFREKSPMGLWPARFGLRRGRAGLDEVDGRTWSQIRSQGRESARKVYEAVRDVVPVNSDLFD